MRLGHDLPGRISQIPGGVALNIAMTLTRFGLRPALLSALGRDVMGDTLIAECAAMGLETGYIFRSEDHPTDRYMAIESAGGLVAAIADAHSLEAAGALILEPLRDGRLGRASAPYEGPVALDGNLTLALLTEIVAMPEFAKCDLRVAPASPGKAERLKPFFNHLNTTLYVNIEEASLLCGAEFAQATEAASALLQRGAARALVTDGAHAAAMASTDGLLTLAPPQVTARRITGAGDTFMAAHIAAELAGQSAEPALQSALSAAAAYVADAPQHSEIAK
ncbi:PfkB family carbohydrate kinase [Litorivita sp. NS0012-18]